MDFYCDITQCKALCCRNCAVLTEDETLDLIENARKEYDFDLELKKYFRKARGENGLYYALKMIKGQCIFLNIEKKCRIYRCRPKLCELYPVIDVDAVDERCPGIVKHKFSREILTVLKKRYADEINERIKKEHTFNFI